eukprot:5023201-Prymnesium_polylepis.1
MHCTCHTKGSVQRRELVCNVYLGDKIELPKAAAILNEAQSPQGTRLSSFSYGCWSGRLAGVARRAQGARHDAVSSHLARGVFLAAVSLCATHRRAAASQQSVQKGRGSGPRTSCHHAELSQKTARPNRAPPPSRMETNLSAPATCLTTTATAARSRGQ